MAVSMILFTVANIPTNIKRYTRHPMLWGLVILALVHLLTNSGRAGLLLFGGMGAYALLGMAIAHQRGAYLQQHTLPLHKDVITITAGLLTYAVITIVHPYLFGVAIV